MKENSSEFIKLRDARIEMSEIEGKKKGKFSFSN